MTTELAYVALGSNLGDRAALMASARNGISLLRGTRLVALSRVEETPPFGAGAQGPYLNQMIAVRTALAPHALLGELHRIERALGRVRRARWAARTIDLDLVRHGSRVASDAALALPHPGIGSRDFWRREMRELDGLVGGAS